MYGAPDVMRAADVRDGESTNARTEVHRSQRRVVQHVVAWDWKEVERGASCSRNPCGHARSSSTFSHVWKCGKLRKTARACEARSFTSCSGECARRQHARSRPCGRMECGVSKPPQVGTFQVLCNMAKMHHRNWCTAPRLFVRLRTRLAGLACAPANVSGETSGQNRGGPR